MVRLDRRQKAPLQSQLCKQIRQLIIRGQLEAGLRLPSTRDLVGQLSVSRNTIVYALDQLVAEGYLRSRTGSGIYVEDLPGRDERVEPASRNIGGRLSMMSVSERASQFSELSTSPSYLSSQIRPFRPCQPALEHFPIRNWNRARSYALRSQTKQLLTENGSAGLPRLRAALATYLRESRGVRCTADQVMITAGTQQALSLIADCFVSPGDPVWIEDPGYLGARAAFLRAGASLIPIPMDREGLTLPVSAQTRRPLLIYTTPSRQFPLGITMSLSRRLELLDFARSAAAWVIEDDYDSEFRYTDRPLPALQGLSDDCVIYTGSFSKVLFPSLRLGYLVAPNQLIDVFSKAKEVHDGSTTALDQATAAIFIEEGFFSTHLRRMRKLYRERRDIFLHEAEKNLSGFVSFPKVEAGMDVIGRLSRNYDDEKCSQRLALNQIDAPPLSAYCLKSSQPGLVFGFTAYSATQTRSSIRSILKVIADMR
jgi:GntR family transcriptional regulator/MocR family aminotransferase